MAPPNNQNLKQKIFTSLTKLSDRDTHSIAVSELNSIAQSLDSTSLPIFLSSIHSTTSSDKSPVRKHCVHLIQILSVSHKNLLSPHLQKILHHIIRRLRDADSSVRSTCVSSISALCTHVTKPPFASFLKPLTEALFTEQDQNSQLGCVLCLASAVNSAREASRDVEAERLARLLPRFERLLRSVSFKAKPALLMLVGCVVEAGALVECHVALSSLVPCVVEFLSSADWSARKAAAETLTKLAVVERNVLSEFKSGCLNVFESRRFDKVKVVREVMNQMCEAWKQIPDISDGLSPPPKSQSSSSSENLSDGRYLAYSQNSCTPGSVMPRMWRKSNSVSKSSPDSSATSNVKKLSFSNKKTSSGVLPKVNHKNRDVGIAVPSTPSAIGGYQGYLEERSEMNLEKTNERSNFSRSEVKRPVFSKIPDETKRTNGGFKTGCRVVPCLEESQDSVIISDVAKNFHGNDKICEELASIRSQLFQIEKQQSNLLNLLERFMTSSQYGMQSLESRVHGLELALEGLSQDLAVSNRATHSVAPGDTCCLPPGAEILSPKFWRKTQGQYPYSQSQSALWYRVHMKGDTETELTNQKRRIHGDEGFTTNPPVEAQTKLTDTTHCA